MKSVISRQLTVPEISERVLEMAKTGVYRQSVFEAFQSLATKKNIRLAIAQAKLFGLHSVAALRDETLGTYYQVDLAQYRACQATVKSAVVCSHSVTTLAQALQIINNLVGIARWIMRTLIASAIALIVVTLYLLWVGHVQFAGGLLLGAITLVGIGLVQRRLLKPYCFYKE